MTADRGQGTDDSGQGTVRCRLFVIEERVRLFAFYILPITSGDEEFCPGLAISLPFSGGPRRAAASKGDDVLQITGANYCLFSHPSNGG